MEENERPWGCYQDLAEEESHKVKRIVVRPRGRLSLQRHRFRDEHWHLVAGRGLMTLGTESFAVTSGESIDIPRGQLHRIENTGTRDLVFIEIQRGDYFGEDDIERVSDDYGR